ncbi:MAG: aminotransferase class IV [Mariprofundus sp.]|nr:aminotransferase class IV [Mariprofundus sp.]
MKINVVKKMDRGLAYGEACFETFRVIDGAIFSWPDHVARLKRGLERLCLTVSDRDIEMMQCACLQAAAAEGGDVLVRLTVSGGEAEWGLFAKSETHSAYIQTMVYHSEQIALMLNQRSWLSPPVHRVAKFTADYGMLLRQLQGERAALLVWQGQLVSAAAANILILRQGEWWTPAVADGVLPGVIRHRLIQAGLVREATCPCEWLDDCDALAVTASSFFVRPVASIQRVSGCSRQLAEHSHTLKEYLCGFEGTPGV